MSRGLIGGSLRACGLLILYWLVAGPSLRARGEDAAPGPRFASSPYAVLIDLAPLAESVGGESVSGETLTPSVERFLARCAEAETLSEAETIDAFIVASGVYAEELRRDYAQRVEKVIDEARGALTQKDTRELADALLRHLHAGPMKAGYEGDQSSLPGLLDTSQFNCVSATALYQLVGRRLGLDLKALEIPGGFFVCGHALSILNVNGAALDVETTNAEGFDPASKPELSGGIAGPQPDREKGRLVEDRTLAALIALNRAGMASEAGRYHEAVQTALIALCISPREAPTQNLIAALNNWSETLVEAGDPAGAVAVYRFGRRLDPRDDVLSHNLECTLEKLAACELAQGRDRTAVELLKNALPELPEGDLEDAPADLFVFASEEAIDRGDWEAALEILARGCRVLDADNLKEVTERYVAAFQRWSGRLREEKKYAEGIAVLVRGAGACGEKEMEDPIGHFVADALIDLVAADDVSQAAEVLVSLRKTFPQSEVLVEAGDRRVYFELEELVDAGKLSEALTRFDRLAPLLTLSGELERARARVFAGCASFQRGEKQWEAALATLRAGLEACPGNEQLVTDSVYTFDAWAQTFIDLGQWSQAIAVYDQGLARFPENRDLKYNRDYCLQKLHPQE